MTPAGIEPATFRFVAQHLNNCATAGPPHSGGTIIFSNKIMQRHSSIRSSVPISMQCLQNLLYEPPPPPPSSPDLTYLHFSPWWFVGDVAYIPQMPSDLGDFQESVSEAVNKANRDTPRRIREESGLRRDICRVTGELMLNTYTQTWSGSSCC